MCYRYLSMYTSFSRSRTQAGEEDGCMLLLLNLRGCPNVYIVYTLFVVVRRSLLYFDTQAGEEDGDMLLCSSHTGVQRRRGTGA